MRLFYIACLCLFFVGCKSNKSLESNDDAVVDTILIDSSGKIIKSSSSRGFVQFIWHIYGTEPFWSFYIHNDTFLFIKVNEKVDSIYYKLVNSYDDGGVGRFILANKINNKIAYLNLYPENKTCNSSIDDKYLWWRSEFIYEKDTLNGCAQEK